MPINRLASRALIALATSGLVSALAACAPHTLPQQQGSLASASPAIGGPLNGTPEPDTGVPQPTPENAPTPYDCNSGTQIKARYPDVNTAVVDYNASRHRMHVGMSADGARYVGDSLEWWTRGTGPNAEATLFVHADDGSTGRLLETCREVN